MICGLVDTVEEDEEYKLNSLFSKYFSNGYSDHSEPCYDSYPDSNDYDTQAYREQPLSGLEFWIDDWTSQREDSSRSISEETALEAIPRTSIFPGTDLQHTVEPYMTEQSPSLDGSSDALDDTAIVDPAEASTDNNHNYVCIARQQIDSNTIKQQMDSYYDTDQLKTVYLCKLCPKRYITNSANLENHLYTKHYGISHPWICLTCQIGFTSQSSAQRHKVNAYASPVQCSNCKKYYSRADYLKKSAYHKKVCKGSVGN